MWYMLINYNYMWWSIDIKSLIKYTNEETTSKTCYNLIKKIFHLFSIIDNAIFYTDFIFKEIINTLKQVIFIDWL